MMRLLDHLIEDVTRWNSFPYRSILGIYQVEGLVILHRLHEIIGDTDRDVEIRNIALVSLAADELEDIGMVHTKHAHIRAASAPSLRDLSKCLIVDSQEAD